METGIVKEIKDNNFAVIMIEHTDDCEACPGKSACNVFSKKSKTIEAIYFDELEVGDNVKIEFQAKYRIISSIIVFLCPLIFFIGFYFIGFLFFKKELFGILSSIIGLVLSFFIIAVLFKKKIKLKRYLPVAIKI